MKQQDPSSEAEPPMHTPARSRHTERAAEEFLTAVSQAGRRRGPSMLVNQQDRYGEHFGHFLRYTLPSVWKCAEFPEIALRPMDIWVTYFRWAGYLTDADDPVEAPVAPLKIYRGAIWRRRRGMAWTTDRERARWFAQRFARFDGHEPFESAYVFEADVHPDGVLAMFRREDEVVVDPRFLPPLRRRASEEWSSANIRDPYE